MFIYRLPFSPVYDVADFSPMQARIRALREAAKHPFRRNATKAGKMGRGSGVGMSVPQLRWGTNDLVIAEPEGPQGPEARIVTLGDVWHILFKFDFIFNSFINIKSTKINKKC
jgi:hypothetical protein